MVEIFKKLFRKPVKPESGLSEKLSEEDARVLQLTKNLLSIYGKLPPDYQKEWGNINNPVPQEVLDHFSDIGVKIQVPESSLEEIKTPNYTEQVHSYIDGKLQDLAQLRERINKLSKLSLGLVYFQLKNPTYNTIYSNFIGSKAGEGINNAETLEGLIEDKSIKSVKSDQELRFLKEKIGDDGDKAINLAQEVERGIPTFLNRAYLDEEYSKPFSGEDVERLWNKGNDEEFLSPFRDYRPNELFKIITKVIEYSYNRPTIFDYAPITPYRMEVVNQCLNLIEQRLNSLKEKKITMFREY